MTSPSVQPLPRRAVRTIVLAIAVVVALVAMTGCDNPADHDAARVGHAELSRKDLIDTADVYATLVGDPYQLEADTNHAYTASGMAAILGEQIVDEIVHAAADRYGLEADPSIVSQLDQQLSTPGSSESVSPLNDLPAGRRQAFLEARALESQLFDYVSSNQWWNDDEVVLYDSLVADGTLQPVQCVHHILVDSEAEADDIVRQLDAGATFEDLAAKSTDTASAQQGGDLGCNPAGSFVPEFEDAIEDAKAGEIVGPVETQFGFHVIRVDQPLAVPTIEESGSTGWLEVLRRTVDVHVDPRYGTWDPSTFSVTPPVGAAAPATDGLNLAP